MNIIFVHMIKLIYVSSVIIFRSWPLQIMSQWTQGYIYVTTNSHQFMFCLLGVGTEEWIAVELWSFTTGGTVYWFKPKRFIPEMQGYLTYTSKSINTPYQKSK